MKPYFLIAPPRLKDPFFFQTVIFLIDHQETGAFGFVINRDIPHTVNQLFSDINWKLKLEQDRNLLWGGPVGDNSCFLLSKDGVRSNHHNQELIHALIEKEQYFEMIVGYSGWGAGQLEAELDRGGWLFTDISLEEMLDIPIKDRYNKALESLGTDLSSLWCSPTFTD